MSAQTQLNGLYPPQGKQVNATGWLLIIPNKESSLQPAGQTEWQVHVEDLNQLLPTCDFVWPGLALTCIYFDKDQICRVTSPRLLTVVAL